MTWPHCGAGGGVLSLCPFRIDHSPWPEDGQCLRKRDMVIIKMAHEKVGFRINVGIKNPIEKNFQGDM